MKYSLGSCTVDTEAYEIRRGGEPVAVEPQVFEQTLSLTGEIYDAALDPALWPETLRRVCEFVGGVATALASEDVAAGTGVFYYCWGDEPDQTRLYFEKYCKLNPILVPMLLLKVGEVRSASQLISRERLLATRFYKEWLSLTGYGDNTFAIIDKSAGVLSPISQRRMRIGCGRSGPRRGIAPS
jgi:hypothetical protein